MKDLERLETDTERCIDEKFPRAESFPRATEMHEAELDVTSRGTDMEN